MKLALTLLAACGALAADVTFFRAERAPMLRLIAASSEIPGVCGTELCVTGAETFTKHERADTVSLTDAFVCALECDEAVEASESIVFRRSLGGACVVGLDGSKDPSLVLRGKFEPLELATRGRGDLTRLFSKHGVGAEKGTRVAFDELKQRAVDSVDPARMFETLKVLSGDAPLPSGEEIATRYTHVKDWQQDGPARALDFVEAQFLRSGLCDRVFRQPIVVRGTPSFNVICEHTGVDDSERVVFGAHWDSTSDNPTVRAPGAVDDGSGTVSVLEVARALGVLAREVGGRLPYTVHVAAWGGEEQGLYGSQQYVDECVRNNVAIRQAIMADMTGYSRRYFGLKVEGTRDSDIQALMSVAKENTLSLGELSHTQTSLSFGSDHVPFQKAGYPCVLFIQQDDTNYTYYHKVGDDTTQINVRQMGAIARVFVATAVDTLMSPF